MKPDIRFGTDGWRALIAHEYTFDNVQAVTRALAAYVRRHQKERAGNGVFVGYDTRFLSREFAQTAAQTFAECGLVAYLSDHACPTPAAAWTTRHQNLATGVMITASHNPPQWNGYKFFAPTGGPADKDATNAIEAVLGRKVNANTAPGRVESFDPRPNFFAQLRKVIDFDLLRANPGHAVCDAVYGTGAGYVDALLRECGWTVTGLRQNPDPMFGGVSADPANERNHRVLQDSVKANNADIGLANDPDADRFGIVDGASKYLTANQVLSLLYVHLLEHRGMRGPVARSVATTSMLDAIARKHGQNVIETPVGFKWVGAAIDEQGAILGGEESCGLSIQGHYPGKDGVLADLLMCEVWAIHKKPLSEVFKDLQRKYGAFNSARIDVHLEGEAKDALLKKMKTSPPPEIAGAKVTNVVTLDGVKLELSDDSWLLLRPSGTEPLVRVYVEAKGQKRLKELTQAAQALS